jgi:hypothetical protein
MHDVKWSKSEKKVARKAFDLAYQRECAGLIKKIQAKAEKLSDPDDIWNLHNFMKKEIRNIGQAYDYRYSALIWVFARLVKDGWLTIDDLKGLSEDKLGRINKILEL